MFNSPEKVCGHSMHRNYVYLSTKIGAWKQEGASNVVDVGSNNNNNNQ